MNFIDEEEVAKTYGEDAPPISTTEPQVIQYEAAHGKVFWSDVERQFVAPSGDVTFYHSTASALIVLRDLHTKWPGEAPKIVVESAKVIDTIRGSKPAAAPAAPPVSRGAMPKSVFSSDDDDDDDRPAPTPTKIITTVAEYEEQGGKRFSLPVGAFASMDATVEISGARLTELLGEPLDGDEWEVSTAWVAIVPEGVVCIHDYRQASTFDDELPEPDDLRSTNTTWRVSGPTPAAVKKVIDALTS